MKSRYEHDGCGVALVARLDGQPLHGTVRRGLMALASMEHRGAEGADAETGDGAGILLQIPDRFFRDAIDFELPEPGHYAVAVCFLPTDDRRRAELEDLLVDALAEQWATGTRLRSVPVRPEYCGRIALERAR